MTEKEKRKRFIQRCMVGKRADARKIFLKSATESINLFELGAKYLDDPNFVLLPGPKVSLAEFFNTG